MIVPSSCPLPPSSAPPTHSYLLQRDEALWERATEFVPERWLSEEEGGVGAAAGPTSGLAAKARPYLPFSQGLRNCVGMR